MRFTSLLPGSLVVLGALVSQVSAYFVITSPTISTAWVNGKVEAVTWTKGVLDGITAFDVEMTRLSDDGLSFIARNVPANKQSALNILFNNITPADDYFLLFINSTSGIMYTTSSRFSILASGTSLNSSQTAGTSVAGVPTVTITGMPNPTQAWGTTFPAVAGGAKALMGEGWRGFLLAAVVSLAAGVWTLW